MQPNGRLVVGVHVGVCVPDPFDEAGPADAKGDSELTFKEIARFLFRPPSTSIHLLIKHDPGLLREKRFPLDPAHDVVPYQVVVEPPIVDRVKIDCIAEELRTRTLIRPSLILSNRDQLLRIAVAPHRFLHLPHPFREHRLGKQPVVNSLDRPALPETMCVVELLLPREPKRFPFHGAIPFVEVRVPFPFRESGKLIQKPLLPCGCFKPIVVRPGLPQARG